MKLKTFQISSKVQSSAMTGAFITLIVAFITNSPLKDNEWVQPFTDSTAIGALITIVSGLSGYLTEETAVKSDEAE